MWLLAIYNHYVFLSSTKEWRRNFPWIFNHFKIGRHDDTSLETLSPAHAQEIEHPAEKPTLFYKSFRLWLIILHFFTAKKYHNSKQFFILLVILSTFSYIDLAQFECFPFFRLHKFFSFSPAFFHLLERAQTRVNINQNILQIIVILKYL